MKISRKCATWLTGLVAGWLIGPALVQAQQLSYSDLSARVAALEAELQAQRTDFASFRNGGPEQTDGKDGGKGNCGCPAWYAGYEVTFLRPYVSDNEFAAGWGNDYGAGHRFVMGYDNGTGIGARMRYWMFNHNHNNAAGAAALNLDVDTLDMEVTLAEPMYNWNMLVSGGFRYGRTAFDFGAGDLYFEGIGPTASLEATRAIGDRGVYLLGNFRGSMLFGAIGGAGAGAFFTADDETGFILENQLGMGWSRELGRGVVDIRATWESQYWYNASLADDIFGFTSALGLAGPTASIEFRY